jgi:hypothetical protein
MIATEAERMPACCPTCGETERVKKSWHRLFAIMGQQLGGDRCFACGYEVNVRATDGQRRVLSPCLR